MVRKHMTVMATVALVMLAALPLSAQQALDARTVIAAASKASGYDNVNTIEFIGSGSEGNAIGQAQSQKGGWVQNQVKEYSRFIDFSAGTSQRNAITSRPLDATGQLPGGAGLGAASARPDTPNTATIAADASFPQRVEIILTPPGFLKLAATATNATVYNRNVGGKRYTVVSFPVADLAPSGVPYRVTGHINDQNLVERVETAIDEAQASLIIGDLNIDQTFSGYKDFNGVKFPTSMVQNRGDVLWTRLDITDVKVNGTAPAPLAAGGGGRGGGGAGRGGGAGAGRGGGAPGGGRGGPGGGAGGGAGAAAGRGGGGGAPGGGGRGGAPANAGPASRKVGDGIYVLTGGYRSMAVEFRDFIVLIEANQNAATTSAAIAEAKRLIPNKPIRYVVNTHNHFDHSGGLRTAAFEGATIVTHEMNKPLYEKWFSNPRTLAAGGPDDLEKSGKKPRFEYVSDKRVIKDDMNTVEIYHINGVVHGEDLMVVYMPKAKILFESDAFNAGAPDAPARTGDEIDGFERQFDSELERLKIDYQFIVPAHQPNPDREVTREEFRKRVGKS